MTYKYLRTLLILCVSALYSISYAQDFQGKHSSVEGIDNLNLSPFVNITEPSNNFIYNQGEAINIKVSASDDDGSILKVAFYNNGEKLGEDTTAPYEFRIANATEGSYNIIAVATDNRGATVTSGKANVSVETLHQAPDVSIISPIDGMVFNASENILVEASASGDEGIEKVVFYNNGLLLGETAQLPYEFAIDDAKAGTYNLTVVAIDHDGTIITSDGLTIIVKNENQAPLVAIASPTNNIIYNKGEDFIIKAEATDHDGGVVKVEFYNDDQKLAEDAMAPFQFTMIGAAVGVYNLKAIATDDEGAVTISSIVKVTVKTVRDEETTLKPDESEALEMRPGNKESSQSIGSKLTPTVKDDMKALFTEDISIAEEYRLTFPNPVQNFLNVVNGEKYQEIRIFDLKGNLLLQNSAHNVIDISIFKPGMYLFQADDEQPVRFIKE